MSGLEIFFLILILVEFVILMYLFASLRKLREAHRVVSEMALDDAEAFTGSLARAKEQDDLERAKLIIEEAERYLTSYKNTLQKHYDRYSTEKTLSDFLPFLKKKKKETIPQTVRTTPLKFSKTKKAAPEARKEEAEPTKEEEQAVAETSPPARKQEEEATTRPKPSMRKPTRKRGKKEVSKETAPEEPSEPSEETEATESEGDDLLPPPD